MWGQCVGTALGRGGGEGWLQEARERGDFFFLVQGFEHGEEPRGEGAS